MKNSVNDKTGIQWTLTKKLEDLDFADDIALLSHSHAHMQEKTSKIAEKRHRSLSAMTRKGYIICSLIS